jgi:hypothetical protein
MTASSHPSVLVLGQRDAGTPYRGYLLQTREARWEVGWESVGNDANTALSQSQVTPLVVTKAANAKQNVTTAKDGYRIDDEVAVDLLNVAKLSPKIYKAYKRSHELFRQSLPEDLRPPDHQARSAQASTPDPFLRSSCLGLCDAQPTP